MSDIGRPPELAWVPVDNLDVDPAYQRTLEAPRSRKLIDKIAAEFNWRKFGALIVTPASDNRYWIIDGQHRTHGARQRGDIAYLPAIVHKGLDQTEQALAFLGANRDRVAMSAQALYHALLLAKDPEAQIIAKICNFERITITRHNISAAKFRARETGAVPMLRRILSKHGEAHLARTVNILVSTWGDVPGALQSGLFMAVSMFLHEDGDERALRETLPRRDWRKLLASAVNTGGIEHGRGRLLCDTLKRWVAEQSVAAEPAPRPFKRGELPSVKPRPQPRRTPSPERSAQHADSEAIEKFLAEKGARVVMSPDQIAAFLRDSGHPCTIQIAEEARGTGGQPPKYLEKARCILDGRVVPVKRIYDLANELRAGAGLAPVSVASTTGTGHPI